MKTITVQAEVTADRILKIEVPCDVPPGQVEGSTNDSISSCERTAGDGRLGSPFRPGARGLAGTGRENLHS